MYWTCAEFWRGALMGYALGGLMGALAMWDFYRTYKGGGQNVEAARRHGGRQ